MSCAGIRPAHASNIDSSKYCSSEARMIELISTVFAMLHKRSQSDAFNRVKKGFS